MTTRSNEEIDWDAYVQDVNAAAKEAFASVRRILGLPEEVEKDVEVGPEEDPTEGTPEEDFDLSTENLLREAVRALQRAEAVADGGYRSNKDYVDIADRYIVLADFTSRSLF